MLFFFFFLFLFFFCFFFSHLEIEPKNNGILHSLIYSSEFPFDILKIIENHRILVVNIILDINLFIYFLSFTLFFSQKEFSAHLGM